jgi:DNA-binding response OmpR family regulator
MMPKTLALFDADREFSEPLALYLREQGIAAEFFLDSADLLARDGVFDFDFYLVVLSLRGMDEVKLISLLRQRSNAGLLVVTGRSGPEVFRDVITAGADMLLAKPVPFEHVLLAIQAVQRRAGAAAAVNNTWSLDCRACQLVTPEGTRVDLSDTDLTVMDAFLVANGNVVSREALRQRLGRLAVADNADGLNATIYRLRRRIQKAAPQVVPLQSRPRVGYVFRAPLKKI